MEDKEKRAVWEKRIKEWQKSGVSGWLFCKENQIPYPTFSYWKKRILEVPQISFVECKEDQKNTGLSFQIQGLVFHLQRDFDPVTLHKFFQVVRQLT